MSRNLAVRPAPKTVARRLAFALPRAVALPLALPRALRLALRLALPLALVALPIALLSGCDGASKAQEAGKPPVAVDVAPAAAGTQVDAVEVVGSLAPKFEAAVKSEYQGVLDEVYVAQWVRVRKGQPLAKLDTREGDVLLQKARAGVEAARAALLQAEVMARQAEREHQRTIELKSAGLATQQQLDDATSAREAAEASVGAARGQLRLAEEEVRHAETRLAKATIRAPMDGVVAERNASPGDMVGEPGMSTAMFRIVANEILDLTVTVPSGRLEQLAVGQPLEFSTEALPGRTFAGTVMFINPTIDAASRTVKVVAEVPNAEGQLRGGMFVRGRIVFGERQGVLQAPRQALLNWDVVKGTGEVFVVDGEVAHRRPVQTGRTAGDAVEIRSGLREGDVVVARGAFNLRDGDRVLVATRGN